MGFRSRTLRLRGRTVFKYNAFMNRGFSLVELSIVLVILGLLTGGILAGQSLIKAAELRSVSTEYNRYVTAMQTFRDKYFGLPGDFTKAIDFWGYTHITPATCITTPGSGTQTCNGDGNGMIQTTSGVANTYSENFTFWQHLANAGLIEGTYTGRVGPGGSSEGTTDNSARSKFSQALWFPFNWDTSYSGTAQYDGVYRDNLFQFGAYGAGGSPGNPVIRAEDAWNLDTKMDDGRPAYGSVRVRFWGAACTDAANSAALNSNYLLTNTTNGCVLLFTMK